MSGARFLVTAALVALAGSGARAATTTDYQIVGDLTAGYDSNPYLDGNSHGSATINLSLAPEVTFGSATGSTVISGNFNRVEYLSHYSASTLYAAGITHTQEFSPELSGSASGSFSDSTSALLQPFSDDAAVDTDLLSSHQRIRTFGGTGGLQWTPSEHDSVSVNGNIERSIYPGDVNQYGNYTSYGGSGSYNRLLSARTTIGAQMVINRTLYQIYPDSTVYEPRVTLKQKLNAEWTVNGSVGLILENSTSRTRSDHSTSASFDIDLCGEYTRLNVCFDASHDAEPSGYGGVRLRWNGSATVSYSITEHSRVSGTAGYARDSSSSDIDRTPSLSLIQANATYDRDLTRKLGLTVSAGYQRRSYNGFGNADGVSVSAGLRLTLGKRR